MPHDWRKVKDSADPEIKTAVWECLNCGQIHYKKTVPSRFQRLKVSCYKNSGAVVDEGKPYIYFMTEDKLLHCEEIIVRKIQIS